MPIEIRIEDGRPRPLVVCDVCGDPIEDSNGNMLYYPSAPQKQYFTHKLCYRVFRQTHEGEHGHAFWQPLPAFLYYLLNNTGYEPAKAERAARIMSMRPD